MNNSFHQSFRDKLIEREQLNPVYKEKYEKEVKAMMEQNLTGIKKLSHIIGLIMGVGFFILFGTLAVIVPKEFPLWGRLIWILGAIFGLVIVVREGWILKKGTINLKEDNLAMAGLGWGFIVIVATITLVFSGRLPDRLVGIHMLVGIIIFYIPAATILLRAIIVRSELNTREKLLEIECRLAELAEQITKK